MRATDVHADDIGGSAGVAGVDDRELKTVEALPVRCETVALERWVLSGDATAGPARTAIDNANTAIDMTHVRGPSTPPQR